MHYSINPAVLKFTISTGHKNSISSVAISPNKSFVISGGSDFVTFIYSLNQTLPLCRFDELRGSIISSKISDDNDFYAFASDEGYLYYGHISNCTKNAINRTDNTDIFYGLEILSSRN